jgi:hypothetical protein
LRNRQNLPFIPQEGWGWKRIENKHLSKGFEQADRKLRDRGFLPTETVVVHSLLRKDGMVLPVSTGDPYT